MYPPSMIACACVAASLKCQAERLASWDSSASLVFTDSILTQLQRITQIENVSRLQHVYRIDGSNGIVTFSPL